MPKQLKCRGLATAACAVITLAYFCGLTVSWMSRPVFSNEFGFAHGAFPGLPGWSRIPTYYESKDGDRLYVDLACDSLVIARADRSKGIENLGWPKGPTGGARFLFSRGGQESMWVTVGSIERRVIEIDAKGNVEELPYVPEGARTLYDTMKEEEDDAIAFDRLEQMLQRRGRRDLHNG